MFSAATSRRGRANRPQVGLRKLYWARKEASVGSVGDCNTICEGGESPKTNHVRSGEGAIGNTESHAPSHAMRLRSKAGAWNDGRSRAIPWHPEPPQQCGSCCSCCTSPLIHADRTSVIIHSFALRCVALYVLQYITIPSSRLYPGSVLEFSILLLANQNIIQSHPVEGTGPFSSFLPRLE